MKKISLFLLLLFAGYIIYAQNKTATINKEETVYNISGEMMPSLNLKLYPDGTYIKKSKAGESFLFVVVNGKIVGSRKNRYKHQLSDSVALMPSASGSNSYGNKKEDYLADSSGRYKLCICSAPLDDMQKYIDSISTHFHEQYGHISIDSVNSKTALFHSMAFNGTFLANFSEARLFVPDTTTTYAYWLTVTLTGAKTTADSIEAVCKWIGENFPYGDYNPISETLSADSIFRNVVTGKESGSCGDYSNFLTKVSEPFASWGTPHVLCAMADTNITHGTGSPSHSFVGYMRPNGDIWCVADPTLGGVVRDSISGNPLSLATIQNWLFKPSHAWRINIHKVTTSLLTDGPCLFRTLLSDTIGVIFYIISEEDETVMTRAHWRSFDDPVRFSLAVPYWTKRGFARMTFMNVYGDFAPAIEHIEVPWIREVPDYLDPPYDTQDNPDVIH